MDFNTPAKFISLNFSRSAGSITWSTTPSATCCCSAVLCRALLPSSLPLLPLQRTDARSAFANPLFQTINNQFNSINSVIFSAFLSRFSSFLYTCMSYYVLLNIHSFSLSVYHHFLAYLVCLHSRNLKLSMWLGEELAVFLIHGKNKFFKSHSTNNWNKGPDNCKKLLNSIKIHMVG